MYFGFIIGAGREEKRNYARAQGRGVRHCRHILWGGDEWSALSCGVWEECAVFIGLPIHSLSPPPLPTPNLILHPMYGNGIMMKTVIDGAGNEAKWEQKCWRWWLSSSHLLHSSEPSLEVSCCWWGSIAFGLFSILNVDPMSVSFPSLSLSLSLSLRGWGGEY